MVDAAGLNWTVRNCCEGSGVILAGFGGGNPDVLGVRISFNCNETAAWERSRLPADIQ